MDRHSDSGHLDLRVQRTYKLLRDAIVSLLAQKNFDQITVQEICEQAMVRRTTFYQHFEDKQDFLIWFIRDKQKEFISRAGFSGDPVNGPEDYLSAILVEVLRYLKENRQLIDALNCSATKDVSPLKEFSSAWVNELTVLLEKCALQCGGRFTVSPAMAAEYYVGGVLAVAKWWYIGGCGENEEEMVASIRTLARGFIPREKGSGREEKA